MAGKATTLVHQALLYSGEGEFLDAAVPFLRAGLTAADVVLVAAVPPRLDGVRRALGPAGEPVLFIDVAEWYRHPVRTLAAYDDFLRVQAPRRVRVLAELDLAARAAPETREWMRYEAVVNTAFGTSGAHAMCAYDRHTAPPGMLAEVRRTHRVLVQGGGPLPRADHAGPDRPGGEPDREPDREPLPLPPVFDTISVESADLHDVRAFVGTRAVRYGLTDDALSGLLVAVTELATNAVKHGTPPMAVRLWAEGGDLICEVADCGCWRPPPSATLGFAPPASAANGGFGLWGVRMLADSVQIRADWDGTVVRLRMRLTG
ncbi:MAG TPA: sensor histidine kinase [Streptosporangiaceae bacterium]|jgi:anti-sigma regulatory factor (Ser/Thr protein kinase)|nr:sensor histidine kinase [Streptosporangiaceae bacterium]